MYRQHQQQHNLTRLNEEVEQELERTSGHVIQNMAVLRSLLFLLLVFGKFLKTHCTELTFELPDKANQCFYEELKEGTKVILDFQVRTEYNSNYYYNYDHSCLDALTMIILISLEPVESLVCLCFSATIVHSGIYCYLLGRQLNELCEFKCVDLAMPQIAPFEMSCLIH